jgi:LemA protein
MDDKQKIEKMKAEGKINAEQAELLLHALNASEARRREVLAEIQAQKKSRKGKAKGFLGASLLVVLILISILFHLELARGPGRDVQKALQEFAHTADYLEKQDYTRAVESIEKGIGKAPHFFMGYTLLGMTYRMMPAIGKTQGFKALADEAFDKAADLRKRQDGKSRRQITGLVFLAIFVVLIISGICFFLLLLYNSLVRREEDVGESLALVATFSQRKLDQIPLVLNAVREFVEHEQETFKAVSEARNRIGDALQKAGAMATGGVQGPDEIGKADEALNLAMGRISALAEHYPELKTDASYLAVQQELAETENQIASARQVYNQKVKKYNAGLKTFPLNLMAAAFGFSARKYFAGAE